MYNERVWFWTRRAINLVTDGTFIYCLLILRTIHGEDYNIFVPQISVTVGIVLAIASISVLIYFIDHASTIIQASHVISQVSADLNDAIDRLFPEKIGNSVSEHKRQVGEIPASFDFEARENCHLSHLQYPPAYRHPFLPFHVFLSLNCVRR